MTRRRTLKDILGSATVRMSGFPRTYDQLDTALLAAAVKLEVAQNEGWGQQEMDELKAESMLNIKDVMRSSKLPMPDYVVDRLRARAKHHRRVGHSPIYAATIASWAKWHEAIWFPVPDGYFRG